jgi:hypothetical protein
MLVIFLIVIMPPKMPELQSLASRPLDSPIFFTNHLHASLFQHPRNNLTPRLPASCLQSARVLRPLCPRPASRAPASGLHDARVLRLLCPRPASRTPASSLLRSLFAGPRFSPHVQAAYCSNTFHSDCFNLTNQETA